jgi:hypothetical protein
MRNIHLFSHVDDAWSHGLRQWFHGSSKISGEGNEKWFVAASLVQANWLRQRCLRENITLFGVKFFDLRLLRRELCRRFELQSPSFGHETLRLLVQTTLSDDPAGFSFAEHLISALDELTSVGWVDAVGLDAALAEFPLTKQTRNLLKDLFQSVFWRPRVDQLLKEKARHRRLHIDLGLFGLGTFVLSEMALLEAIATTVSHLDAWLPQAIANESIGFDLVTTLEHTLHCQHLICPDSGTSIPYGAFIAHWSGQNQTAVAPEIVVSDGWNDQIRSVVTLVVNALNEGIESIVIIVPENSATGSAILNALAEHKIVFADEFRQKLMGSAQTAIQIAVLDFLQGNQDAKSFLNVVDTLITDPILLRQVRRIIHNAFNQYQVPSIQKLHLQETAPDWLLGLINLLNPWPDQLDWQELSDRWQNLLQNLTDFAQHGGEALESIQLGTETIEPLWHEIGNFIGNQKVSSRLFLRFVRELISSPVRQIHPNAGHRYSNVIVTTAQKAFGCSWDLTILLDSTTSGWPLLSSCNPLLDDRRRIQLRSQGFLLPTAIDQRQSEIDLYLQLIYQTRTKAILTYFDRDEKGDELVANDLVTFSRQFLNPKLLRYARAKRTEQEISLSRFAEISIRRRDATVPFDDWFLNFSSAGFSVEPWSPSTLEKVICTPATFAFEKIFRSKREWDRRLFREARRTIGQVVHKVLSGALGEKKGIVEITSIFGFSKTNEEIRATLLNRVKRAWEAERTALPADIRNLWWESILDQVRITAEQIAEHLAEHLHNLHKEFWLATERRIEGSCRGNRYELKLAGRTDLILLDRADYEDAVITIFDFKTGKSPQKIKLAKGIGLQFYVYQRLFETVGATTVNVYQSRTDKTSLVEFGDPAEAIPMLERLSQMQRSFCFGQMPDPISQFEPLEVLPISSPPYASELLEAKRTLSFPGHG